MPNIDVCLHNAVALEQFMYRMQRKIEDSSFDLDLFEVNRFLIWYPEFTDLPLMQELRDRIKDRFVALAIESIKPYQTS